VRWIEERLTKHERSCHLKHVVKAKMMAGEIPGNFRRRGYVLDNMRRHVLGFFEAREHII
jgi:hypothetical protein